MNWNFLAGLSAPHNGPSDPLPAVTSPLSTPVCLDALEANLREPLRALDNAADALALTLSPDQLHHIQQSIRHAALMIERRADAALDVIRCQHGVLQPDVATFTLRSLLHESAITARSAPVRTRRVFQVQSPSEEVVISADRRRLVRVVAGLLSAADAWAEEGSPIALSATWSEPEPAVAQLEILVRVPTESAPHITRPLLAFLDPSYAPPSHASEVLAAIALARHFGAPIRASQVPPGMSLQLRCHLVATRPGAHHTAPAPPVRPAPVLMLDTPARSLRPLENGLLQAGYEPLRAQHRDEALELLFGRSPAVVLVATDRSSDHGLHFARQVRVSRETSRLPILLVAHDLGLPELLAARRSVDAILVGPLATDDVVRYINGCLVAPDRRAARRDCELY